MDSYERSIGLKTIYLTFVRRYIYILIIFVPILMVSFFVTNFGMRKTYQSSAVVSKNAVFNAAQYQTYQNIVTSDTTLKTVAEDLKAQKITHSNGAEITTGEIASGISLSAFNSSSTSINVTLYYQSSEQGIITYVLNSVAKTSATAALAKDASGFAGIAVSSEAGTPSMNSNNRKYFLIAVAAGAVLALGVPFIYEIVGDEVWDKNDVENLGCEGFNLKLKK